MLNIKTINGNLFVSGDTWAVKEQLKELPATRWHKASKSYVMPATVGAIRNLYEMCKEADADLAGDKGFYALYDFMVKQDEAQQVKKHACDATCVAWHHQGEALKFAENQPAVIFNMPTGTGKTKLNVDLSLLRGHQFILVVTKKKAVSVWKKSVQTFAPGQINVVQLDTGSVAKNMKLAAEAAKDTSKPIMLVTNYQSIWRDPFKSWILKQPVDLLIADESHVAKAAGSKASMFLKTLRKKVACVAALTATFFGDKPVDIYAQMRFIDPAVYGTSFAKFKDEYCYMGGVNNREILGYKNQDKMMQKVAPYIFQVDKAVLNLIPARHKTYYCTLDSSLQKMYNTFWRDAFVSLDEGVVSADNILVKLLKAQQMACGFTKIDDTDEVIRIDTSKLDTLEDILNDLPDMENIPQHTPVVVYARFTEDLRGIKALATKLGYTYGEISGAIDQQEDFKAGKINLLGCQINAGGTGVDGLQEVAHIGIYYSTGHSLIEYVQSLGRLDRPGQKNSVLNIYIVAENTVDEDIVQALQNKEDVIKFLENKLKALAKGVN
jgi:superfamily II DNA or RNA helicase